MGNDLTDALAALTGEAAGQTTRKDSRLPEPRPAAPIPGRIGSGKAPSGTQGGGIASPLVETVYADRTFHPETVITSTDGIFTLKIKPVKTINLKDANNADVTIEFKAQN